MVPITFAHRGARAELPENTIPAFRRALEQGARGLETDAWVSRDGEVVLVHDPVARRGIRRVRVDRASAADLATVGVPRLVEVFDELGTDFELSVDVKMQAAAAGVIDVVRSYGAAERLWLCTHDLALARQLRPAVPDVHLVHSVRRPNLHTPLERHAADLAEVGIDAMNFHHTEWTVGLVALFHRFGVRAFAWDAQEARHLRAVVHMGVDAVYCDRPARMVAVVGEYS